MAKKVAPKKQVRPAKAAIKANVKSTQSSIGSWNKWLALVFGVQAIVILLFSSAQSFPITINYLGLDSLQTNAQGKTVFATGSQTLFNLNLAYVVAAFLIVVAVVHGLLASRFQKQYEQGLNAETNTARWIGYAVGGSLLTASVALVAGVQDISSLFMIIGLVTVMFLLGLFAERLSQAGGRIKWVLYWIAVVLGLIAWGAIKLYLVGGTFYGSVPAYVYWISIVAFVLMAGLFVNLFLQLRKFKSSKNYLYCERMYMIGSLVLFTVTAWMIYVAILRP